jgi:GrpB-like predicted nucleotidyltransferase (UPF0157 family)
MTDIRTSAQSVWRTGRLLTTAMTSKLAEDAVLLKVRAFQKGAGTPRDHAALTAIHRHVLARLRKARESAGIPVIDRNGGELGLHNSSVQIVSSDPRWTELFVRESALIRERLGDRLRAIHHIGSTAVPGLPAKPILDLALVLDAATFERDFAVCRHELAALGYRYLGDYGHRGGRLFEKGPYPIRTHAIQVHPIGADDLSKLLRFQQILRDDPALLEEYAATKVLLAMHLSRLRLLYAWYKSHWIGDVLLRGMAPTAWGPWMIAKKQQTAFQAARHKLAAWIRRKAAATADPASSIE